MPFPPSPGLFKVTLRGVYLQQQWANVFHYKLDPVPTGGADETALAFWEHVKAQYRPLAATNAIDFFQTVTAEHLGGDRAFAVYNIPTAERTGTLVANSENPPSFMAAGIRLNVITRQTRPGQKRVVLTQEAVFNQQSLVTSFRDAVAALGIRFAGEISITIDGNPVIAVPVVVSFRPGAPTPVTIQKIQSATVNNNVTTQVTRKVGRGD